MSIMNLVKGFIQAAKDMHGDYVESWLRGEVNDYDFDMTLINEKQCRETTYKRLALE